MYKYSLYIVTVMKTKFFNFEIDKSRFFFLKIEIFGFQVFFIIPKKNN